MAITIWNDTLSVGVEKLDTDHIILFSLINYLNDTRLEGKGEKIVGPLLNALIGYAETHFSREEGMLRIAEYDENAYLRHKEEHDQFTKKVLGMKKAFLEKGPAGMSEDLGEFLSQWLADHILEVDMRYKEALTARRD
tara:strand:- start:100 stop:513 length:414 start_codon:yes stop_codon:yes gene_type:complete